MTDKPTETPAQPTVDELSQQLLDPVVNSSSNSVDDNKKQHRQSNNDNTLDPAAEALNLLQQPEPVRRSRRNYKRAGRRLRNIDSQDTDSEQPVRRSRSRRKKRNRSRRKTDKRRGKMKYKRFRELLETRYGLKTTAKELHAVCTGDDPNATVEFERVPLPERPLIREGKPADKRCRRMSYLEKKHLSEIQRAKH
jgi:hypothetical protein